MPDLSLQSAAEHIGLSAQYISKIFKEFTDTNFSDYTNSVRIENARRMIVESDLTIKEISSLVGFNSSQHFSRVFVRYSSVTPGQYRAMHQTDRAQGE